MKLLALVQIRDKITHASADAVQRQFQRESELFGLER